MAGYQKLSGGSDREALASLADDIGADAGQRSADGHVRHLLEHSLAYGIYGCFCRTVSVDQPVILGRCEASEFLSTGEERDQRLVFREIDCELGGNLRGHHHVGDIVLLEEVVQCNEIQPKLIRDDEQGGAGSYRGDEVPHSGVEAETCIGCSPGVRGDAQNPGVSPGVRGDVPM